MTLIDDICDGCGMQYDPMGDPYLKRHPEISQWAVYCGSCETSYEKVRENPQAEFHRLNREFRKTYAKLIMCARIKNDLARLLEEEGIETDVAAVDLKRRLEKALAFGDDEE